MAGNALSPGRVGEIATRIIEETLPLVDLNVKVEPEEYRARWGRVQAAMKEQGYALAFACGSELDRSDIAWLAGVFDPIIERYAIFIPAEGRPVVLAGSEGGHVIEEATEFSGAHIALLMEFQISDEEYRHARFRTLGEVMGDMGLGAGPHRVAVLSSPEFIPHGQVTILQEKFGADHVQFDPLLLQLIKYEKSDTELAIARQANIIADAAFRAMLAVTVPGMMEIQVAGVGDFVMRELGAQRAGFPTIVTSGERGYTVIGPASTKVIEKGDMVSLGISPTFNGYHGIIRRTVRAGADFTPAQKEFISATEGLYHAVMKATIKAAAQGLPSKTIDQAGKAYLESLKLTTLDGRQITPMEPYTFIHNTGCSECQEGYGAVTPYTDYPLGNQVLLMIDTALLGFEEWGKPTFGVLYAVVEDAFWKKGRQVGVFNRLPLNVQHLVGNDDPLGKNINPYYQEPPVG